MGRKRSTDIFTMYFAHLAGLIFRVSFFFIFYLKNEQEGDREVFDSSFVCLLLLFFFVCALQLANAPAVQHTETSGGKRHFRSAEPNKHLPVVSVCVCLFFVPFSSRASLKGLWLEGLRNNRKRGGKIWLPRAPPLQHPPSLLHLVSGSTVGPLLSFNS